MALQKTASSKSLASLPSIVTNGVFLRSSLLLFFTSKCFNSASTSFDHSYGKVFSSTTCSIELVRLSIFLKNFRNQKLYSILSPRILPLGSCNLVSKLKSGASYNLGADLSNIFERYNLKSRSPLVTKSFLLKDIS